MKVPFNTAPSSPLHLSVASCSKTKALLGGRLYKNISIESRNSSPNPSQPCWCPPASYPDTISACQLGKWWAKLRTQGHVSHVLAFPLQSASPRSRQCSDCKSHPKDLPCKAPHSPAPSEAPSMGCEHSWQVKMIRLQPMHFKKFKYTARNPTRQASVKRDIWTLEGIWANMSKLVA